jgi:hypothetical protein
MLALAHAELLTASTFRCTQKVNYARVYEIF